MSSPKFAAMTSSLLARKGDAAPSLGTISALGAASFRNEPRPPKEPEPPPTRLVQPPAVFVPHTDEHERLRRVMITVTPEELEKLGIAAVKKGLSRHQVVREALDAYFLRLAAELPHKCNCMTSGSCCQ